MDGLCSEKCYAEYTRQCNNPSPQYGGESCEGLDQEAKPCDSDDCYGLINTQLLYSSGFINELFRPWLL